MILSYNISRYFFRGEAKAKNYSSFFDGFYNLTVNRGNLPRIIIAKISTISIDVSVSFLPDHFIAITVVTISILAILPFVAITIR